MIYYKKILSEFSVKFNSFCDRNKWFMNSAEDIMDNWLVTKFPIISLDSTW